MNRREFLRNSLVAGAALEAASLIAHAAATPSRKNWVWVTLNAQRPPDDWKRMFATMRAGGVQAILPEIYDGRHAYFASQQLPVMTRAALDGEVQGMTGSTPYVRTGNLPALALAVALLAVAVARGRSRSS